MRTSARAAVSAAVLVLVSTLAACGGDAEEGAGGSEPAGEGASSDAYPVTIEHEFGETTIEEEPETVVVLGVTDVDAVLALGTVPVATAGYPFYDDGVGPWAREAAGDAEIEFIENEAEPDIEAIAGMAPDLVVAISSGLDQDVYDQLSQFTQVLARPAGVPAYTATREDATLMIGEALGKVEEAEDLLAETDAAFEAAVEAHPEFTQATGTVVLPYDGKYGAYTPGDARGQFMEDLGFRLPEALAAKDDGSSFFIELSREQLDLADGDVLVALVDDATRSVVEDDQILQSLPVVEQGGLIVTDEDTRGALTYNTVLSVPFAIDSLVPQLADAVAATS
jgi:iron complex transport system substrate-binding protein